MNNTRTMRYKKWHWGHITFVLAYFIFIAALSLEHRAKPLSEPETFRIAATALNKLELKSSAHIIYTRAQHDISIVAHATRTDLKNERKPNDVYSIDKGTLRFDPNTSLYGMDFFIYIPVDAAIPIVLDAPVYEAFYMTVRQPNVVVPNIDVQLINGDLMLATEDSTLDEYTSEEAASTTEPSPFYLNAHNLKITQSCTPNDCNAVKVRLSKNMKIDHLAITLQQGMLLKDGGDRINWAFNTPPLLQLGSSVTVNDFDVNELAQLGFTYKRPL